MSAPARLLSAAAIAAGLALGALALAACAPSDPSPRGASPSPTPATTLSAGPSSKAPTPSPSATAADCEMDGIVPGRLGCLDTNLPVAGNPGESAVTWEADHCSAGDGRFVYTAAPTLVGLGGEGGGKIGRIDVYDPSLTTAEGIHVGSTAAEVAAAYPATPAVTAFSGTQLVVLSGAEGFITIELADGWGAEPLAVANIRIYATDQEAHVPVYGTEDLAGACPMDF